MPELPEVETIRIGLERQVIGATIARAEFFDFPGVAGGTLPEQFNAAVSGERIDAIRRRGKYLLIQLDNGPDLVVHLRMTGQLLVACSDAPPTRFEHLRFHFADGRQLRFADQRKFGRVTLATPADLALLDRRLGIEPLSDQFTARWLAETLSRRSAKIKALLLDQAVIAGIGNIYADEALFRSRIHPRRLASDLSGAEVRSLHRNLRLVLRGSIDRGGPSFSTYRNSSGEPGTNQLALQIYGLGRLGRPCPRCGRPLTCIQVAGRSSHICERCQVHPGEAQMPQNAGGG